MKSTFLYLRCLFNFKIYFTIKPIGIYTIILNQDHYKLNLLYCIVHVACNIKDALGKD